MMMVAIPLVWGLRCHEGRNVIIETRKPYCVSHCGPTGNAIIIVGGAEQKEFINALWQHLPTLYEQMQLGRNWQRRGERRLGDGWDERHC